MKILSIDNRHTEASIILYFSNLWPINKNHQTIVILNIHNLCDSMKLKIKQNIINFMQEIAANVLMHINSFI